MSEKSRRLTPSFRPAQVTKSPPCQLGCPNGGDIRGWIGIVAQRDKIGLTLAEAYARAWTMITDVNPFPSVLGRVCPHPCESQCNRGSLDEPLAINAMERFLGDWAIGRHLPLPRSGEGPYPESIGVVGAGPSGLSFAYQMARRGYDVTVYESRSQAGGMLRYGIPEYRLPRDILDAEIQRICDMGVDLRLDTRIGRDFTLEDLRLRHDAVYLGIGAQKGRGLDVPGATGPSAWSGTEYLGRVNDGQVVDLGRRVIVVGGGNTAVDAARTARRTGAEVTILYRRSRAEMPAGAQEIDDALEEGVQLVLQAVPVRLERAGDALRSLIACRMGLGSPDSSGRRRPVVIPGSEFAMPVDSVIAAVSQEPDLAGIEFPDVGWCRRQADEPGAVGERMWIGGDVVEPGIAGHAIVHGRYAAEALHAQLRGLPSPPRGHPEWRPVGPGEILQDVHVPGQAARLARLSPEARLRSPAAEVTAGMSEEALLREVTRCFSCGACFGCEQCVMYCTPRCFTKLETIGPGQYFSLSLDACQECGKCVAVCPSGYLEVAPPPV